MRETKATCCDVRQNGHGGQAGGGSNQPTLPLAHTNTKCGYGHKPQRPSRPLLPREESSTAMRAHQQPPNQSTRQPATPLQGFSSPTQPHRGCVPAGGQHGLLPLCCPFLLEMLLRSGVCDADHAKNMTCAVQSQQTHRHLPVSTQVRHPLAQSCWCTSAACGCLFLPPTPRQHAALLPLTLLAYSSWICSTSGGLSPEPLEMTLPSSCSRFIRRPRKAAKCA